VQELPTWIDLSWCTARRWHKFSTVVGHQHKSLREKNCRFERKKKGQATFPLNPDSLPMATATPHDPGLVRMAMESGGFADEGPDQVPQEADGWIASPNRTICEPFNLSYRGQVKPD